MSDPIPSFYPERLADSSVLAHVNAFGDVSSIWIEDYGPSGPRTGLG